MNAANSISLKSFLLNSADVFDGDIKIEKTAMTDAEISNAQDLARGSLEKNSRTVRLPTKLSTPASINIMYTEAIIVLCFKLWHIVANKQLNAHLMR